MGCRLNFSIFKTFTGDSTEQTKPRTTALAGDVPSQKLMLKRTKLSSIPQTRTPEVLCKGSESPFVLQWIYVKIVLEEIINLISGCESFSGATLEKRRCKEVSGGESNQKGAGGQQMDSECTFHFSNFLLLSNSKLSFIVNCHTEFCPQTESFDIFLFVSFLTSWWLSFSLWQLPLGVRYLLFYCKITHIFFGREWGINEYNIS